MQHGEKFEYTQHGGVCLIINAKWSGRVIRSGGYQMGRWYWETL